MKLLATMYFIECGWLPPGRFDNGVNFMESTSGPEQCKVWPVSASPMFQGLLSLRPTSHSHYHNCSNSADIT